MYNPEMIKIRQHFNGEHITDIEGEVRRQIELSKIIIRKNANIALAVGSRGIANIDRIVKTVVQIVKEMGGNPFIVPAMGSHGGANASGQKEVLEGYGVTEELVGAPIRSSMQVVELPQGDLKNKVYMDKNAYEADGTIIINRIKVHTDFHGEFESGLMKMCVIGLGKHKQALEIHRYGVYGLRELIPPTARQVLKYGNIILGIGIVENAYDKTAIIQAIKPSEIEEKEKMLLSYNKKNMPSLPVDSIDILVIDKMGKDISGVGIDTNIIGRMRIASQEEPKTPNITNIIVTDLTEASHGNALGMGLADIITQRLFQKIDLKATYENVITSTFLERGKIPIVANNDRQAVQYALRTCGPIDLENIRVVRIKNTLHLDEVYVSKSILAEIENSEGIEIMGSCQRLLNDQDEFFSF